MNSSNMLDVRAIVCSRLAVFAILAAYVLAAAWGAGNETMPLAAGAAHGSALQEVVIRGVLSPSRSFSGAFALRTLNQRTPSSRRRSHSLVAIRHGDKEIDNHASTNEQPSNDRS